MYSGGNEAHNYSTEPLYIPDMPLTEFIQAVSRGELRVTAHCTHCGQPAIRTINWGHLKDAAILKMIYIIPK